MEDFIAAIMLLLLFGASVGIYLVPTIIAYTRDHKNRLAITMLNIFAGWLVIGWIIALVWACTKDTK